MQPGQPLCIITALKDVKFRRWGLEPVGNGSRRASEGSAAIIEDDYVLLISGRSSYRI